MEIQDPSSFNVGDCSTGSNIDKAGTCIIPVIEKSWKKKEKPTQKLTITLIPETVFDNERINIMQSSMKRLIETYGKIFH